MLSGLIASPLARRLIRTALAVLTIVFFLFNLRRAGERAGRAAERLDTLEAVTHAQRQMLDEASRRPRNRNDLVDRLRDGEF
ncbi:hypothetical protein [Aliiroseovarius sp. S1123]|uniref:hypothetical protein n=1 Tax=Aliiroseovarius sp. S1123 TaxID=2926404 RepID=UPI001FF6C832|nr:hypothetical protein [Aliiroseovarius sp. S1123]